MSTKINWEKKERFEELINFKITKNQKNKLMFIMNSLNKTTWSTMRDLLHEFITDYEKKHWSIHINQTSFFK